MFLQARGNLSFSSDWLSINVLNNSGLLEGVARLPSQLLGSHSSTPTTAEAVMNARDTSDLLRRFREMGERMKQEYGSSNMQLSEAEQGLRVSPGRWPMREGRFGCAGGAK